MSTVRIGSLFSPLLLVIVAACDDPSSQAVFDYDPAEIAVPVSLTSADPPEAGRPAPTSRLDDELLGEVLKRTVRIRTTQGVGSGVVLEKDPEGRLLILTARHVVESPVLSVGVYSLSSTSFPEPMAELKSELVAVSSRTDLAMLRTAIAITDFEPSMKFPRLAFSKSSVEGEYFSCGCDSQGPPMVLTEQVLSSVDIERSGGVARWWRTSSPQRKGRSGGPLFDGEGQLVGIASAKHGQHGYYCHIEEVEKFLVDSGVWMIVESEPAAE